MVMTARSPYLIDYDELPAYAKHGPYVQTGYRRPGDAAAAIASSSETVVVTSGVDYPRTTTSTLKQLYVHDTFYKCWKSVWCYWHNETMNIHTHLWGSVLAFIVLLLQLADVHGWLPPGPWPILSMESFPSHNPLELFSDLGLRMNRLERLREPSHGDLAAMTVFLLSAMLCLGCSATYHTLACHSHKVAQSYNRLDYAGIVILIVGSNVPALHFGFHCHGMLRTIYMVMVFFWGMLTFYVVTQPHFTSPKYKALRAFLFVVLGLSGILPLLHGLYVAKSWHFVADVLGAKYVMYSGAVYIIGAMIYVAHFPEAKFPRTFDYIGASHQIFHVCVLAGAFLHWLGVRQAYTFWHALETLSGETAQDAVCYALHKAIGV
ncbi:intracellular zinc ion homeostasis protein [Malassezia pachydermatis]